MPIVTPVFVILTDGECCGLSDGGQGEKDGQEGSETQKPPGQEGRGRSCYPQHEAQASLHWQEEAGQDR